MGALLKLDDFVDNQITRDKYIDRTEVLEKVKSLSMLPDNKHMTVRATADFYEVEYKAIASILTRHKKELEHDGVSTITSKDEAFCKLKKALPDKQFVVKLLPKKAILRIGMLLRDSEVAVKVRNYLLKIEETSTEEQRGVAWNDADVLTLNRIFNEERSKGNSKMESIRIAAKAIKKNPHAVYQKYRNVTKKHGSLENYIATNNSVYFNKQSEEIYKTEIQENNKREETPIVVGAFQAKINRMIDNLKNVNDLEATVSQLKLELSNMKHQLEIKVLELEAKAVEVTKKDRIISKLKKDKLALDASVKAIRKIVLNGVKVNNTEETNSSEVEIMGRTYTRDKNGMIELKK
ncbi:hypothetical protein ACIFOE_13255 [Paenibacillus sp. NRS-1783]|uniref:hypothetical protein n=1 Tax=Paenibacillus sp. NRS-1783 TaxID=3233907 RepID=UPI003D2A9DAC